VGKIKELYLHWQETEAYDVLPDSPADNESSRQMAFWHWVHNEADKEGFLAEEIEITEESLIRFNTEGEVMHDKKLQARVKKLEDDVFDISIDLKHLWKRRHD